MLNEETGKGLQTIPTLEGESKLHGASRVGDVALAIVTSGISESVVGEGFKLCHC